MPSITYIVFSNISHGLVMVFWCLGLKLSPAGPANVSGCGYVSHVLYNSSKLSPGILFCCDNFLWQAFAGWFFNNLWVSLNHSRAKRALGGHIGRPFFPCSGSTIKWLPRLVYNTSQSASHLHLEYWVTKCKSLSPLFMSSSLVKECPFQVEPKTVWGKAGPRYSCFPFFSPSCHSSKFKSLEKLANAL